MSLIVPLPKSVADLIPHNTHPGLALDKYVESWNEAGFTKDFKWSERVQRPAVDRVVELSQGCPSGLDFAGILARWEHVTAGATKFTGTTVGPLTLHLARASALENAGICLHPLYGFTYFPGSGLKGLARAFATEIWLPQQPHREEGENTILRIFGSASKDNSAAGTVVFHEAWPTTWPKLVTDILNNHHHNYYAKGEPPGDWEDPIPVYFLSLATGQKFRFAVSPRLDDESIKADVTLAADWLVGGLTTLGVGAKTATGYGDFTVDRIVDPIKSDARPSVTATLELVTPAFLAGAKQQAEDCDLRPATLRGMMRWWWRTLHAGFVDTATLRRMEAAIWGDTKTGGAVRVTVTPVGPMVKAAFDRSLIRSQNKIPDPPDRKTTPGLTYHSYGMDEKKDGVLTRRMFIVPGAKWIAKLTARASKFEKVPLPANLVLTEAIAALELLCQWGGVGAKCRKGFGSFRDLADFDLERIRRSAAAFRSQCGLGTPTFVESKAESPAVQQMLPLLELPTGGINYWLALDQLAGGTQHFAKRYKHRVEKKALGLPRKIGAPVSGTFRAGKHVAKDRHASPVFYHFSKADDGKLTLRAVAFPSPELPNLTESRRLLNELLTELKATLPIRFKDHVAGKVLATVMPTAAAPSGPKLTAGMKVKAKICPDPKGKARAFAEYRGLVGNILNMPAGLTVNDGDEVDLIINSVNETSKQIAFRWPT